MRLHRCPACGGPLWFGNLVCACGAQALYDPQAGDGPGRGAFVADGVACANRERIGCNWIASDPSVEGAFCHACAMTDTAPDQALPEAVAQWADAEAAKRWVLTNLARWGWWTPDDPGPLPRFDMLAEETRHGPVDVIMGHAQGRVTINLSEADPAERAKRREDLGEPYRTLIGHFRHELAHALQLRLSALPGFLEPFRELFGDEREDYGAALQRHYSEGPPADWSQAHVSAYASAHPHEDWAESAAHLMHLTDIVDSFAAAGLRAPEGGPAHVPDVPGIEPGLDAYSQREAEALIDRGCALGLALNHVNRSMGLADLYPFVLAAPAREKLAFVHRWLAAGPGAPQAGQPEG